jgi:hypothetical protein
MESIRCGSNGERNAYCSGSIRPENIPTYKPHIILNLVSERKEYKPGMKELFLDGGLIPCCT